ncbi:tubulin polyglutamylase TTLL-4, partial [Kipferlia bialata]
GIERLYIVKPVASSRGRGIRLISKKEQLPDDHALVQRYIVHPFLINGLKFDLRMYVLVTSIDPLRVYLYPEGLVRFATHQYKPSCKNAKDRSMHLTNYSINR